MHLELRSRPCSTSHVHLLGPELECQHLSSGKATRCRIMQPCHIGTVLLIPSWQHMQNINSSKLQRDLHAGHHSGGVIELIPICLRGGIPPNPFAGATRGQWQAGCWSFGEQNSDPQSHHFEDLQADANGLITAALRFRKVSPQATSLRKSGCESCLAKFLRDEDCHWGRLIPVEPSGQHQGSQLREIFELVRRVLSGIPGRKTIHVVQDGTFTSQTNTSSTFAAIKSHQTDVLKWLNG